jgi:hypothetical protein
LSSTFLLFFKKFFSEYQYALHFCSFLFFTFLMHLRHFWFFCNSYITYSKKQYFIAFYDLTNPQACPWGAT